MGGFKCKVTNSVSNTPLAAPKPPVWCEGAPNNCTKGAKQILAWHQQSGTNIEVTGFDLAGDHKSPAYNSKCGFANGEFVKVFFFVFVFLSFFCMFFWWKEIGAQNDIFEGDVTGNTDKAVVNSPPPTSSAPPKTTPSTTPVKAPSGGSCNPGTRWVDDDTPMVKKSIPNFSNYHRRHLLKSRLL